MTEHSPHSHHDDDFHHHDHRDHDHGRRGVLARLRADWHPHSHDHAGAVDSALLADRSGRRALWVSLSVLLVTGVIQAWLVAVSGSVGLLADTVHNVADALTAVPIGLAFWVARRPATGRYTYGFGRAEDLAGLAVVAVMTVSAATAAWQAITRLLQPGPVHHLPWVAVAGLIGFAGNTVAARYRISTGRRIGSAALIADGQHARADACTSLAVVAGAGGVAAGWQPADAVAGIAITIAIALALAGAARGIYRRLMDAVDPGLAAQIQREAATIAGVLNCGAVRVRWIGHELYAELDVTVSPELTVGAAHELTEVARHELLHRVLRLADARIHVNPQPASGTDAHALTAHHFAVPGS